MGIADYDGEAKFYSPENPNYISHTILNRSQTHDRAIVVKVNKLQTILRELGHDHVNVLKMDIEGAEYNVLKDMISTNIRPEQILVEFHHFFEDVSTLKSIQTTILLWSNGYKIFSVSDRGYEYSFILKNALKNRR